MQTGVGVQVVEITTCKSQSKQSDRSERLIDTSLSTAARKSRNDHRNRSSRRGNFEKSKQLCNRNWQAAPNTIKKTQRTIKIKAATPNLKRFCWWANEMKLLTLQQQSSWKRSMYVVMYFTSLSPLGLRGWVMRKLRQATIQTDFLPPFWPTITCQTTPSHRTNEQAPFAHQRFFQNRELWLQAFPSPPPSPSQKNCPSPILTRPKIENSCINGNACYAG